MKLRNFDWIALILGVAILVAIMCTLQGCDWWKPRMPPAPTHDPVLAGPPAPPAQPVDPLIPFLAWISWISVAGMGGSIVGAVFLSLFRSTAISAFLSFGALLIFARTLGHALPWLPWIGFLSVILYVAYAAIQRYRAVAVAAIAHIPAEVLPTIETGKTAIQKHMQALIAKIGNKA